MTEQRQCYQVKAGIIKTDSDRIFIISEKELTIAELEQVTQQGGIASLGRRGIFVTKADQGESGIVDGADVQTSAKARVCWEYEKKGHVIYPPHLACLDWVNCTRIACPDRSFWDRIFDVFDILL